MRQFRYVVALGFASILIYFVKPLIDGGAQWLDSSVFASRPSASWGISASITSSIVLFLYISFTQNRTRNGYIIRYRWAEQKLIDLKKMSREEILDYHRCYNWHAYAGLGFSTLFIVIPLFFGGQIKFADPVDRFAIYLGLGLLGISTVMLVITDLFHTNTLTPLITADRRFALMDMILKLGGAALMLQVCAAGVFLSLINSWLSIATVLVSVWLTIFITERRGIPTISLQRERQLNEDEAVQVENA